ncbi:MAG: septation regulator SpoVG [bacterium]|nr:septation regulator SpoVG [bacterium]
MKITDVRLKKVDGHNRLKAIASVTIDDCFVIHELRIIDGDNGLFIAMPSRKLPEGEFKDIAHPINAETREQLEKAVLDEYNKQEEK